MDSREPREESRDSFLAVLIGQDGQDRNRSSITLWHRLGLFGSDEAGEPVQGSSDAVFEFD